MGGFLHKDSASSPAEAADVKQLVADYSAHTLAAGSASVTSRELIVNAGSAGEKAYPLPDDEFFVSIAPYIESTHPCATHSLTGCQGELKNQEFQVRIEDGEGKAVVDEQLASQANGFIDLWLPRGQTFTVTIEQDGKRAVSELSTFDENDTCIASMQLM
ncbi:CueP family metal-binding protein [Paenibacillus tengchongensis]|uniref:CueP family metal-binding protein n=1 Tax=Paenibacillus tengchongensis TaxID=2608684 RepID=UPI003CCD818F